MSLFGKIWISPAKHAEIVEELNARIRRLEADYVELARSVIAVHQARIAAARMSDRGRRLDAQHNPDGTIVAVDFRHRPPATDRAHGNHA